MNPFEVLYNPNKWREEFLTTFKRIFKPLNETDIALTKKVEYMIKYKCFNSTIRMLCSFSKGTKRIKGRYKWGMRDDKAHWVESSHGDYESLGENDGKGHFRWDHGELYTLSPESLKKLEKFIKLLKLDEL